MKLAKQNRASEGIPREAAPGSDLHGVLRYAKDGRTKEGYYHLRDTRPLRHPAMARIMPRLNFSE